MCGRLRYSVLFSIFVRTFFKHNDYAINQQNFTSWADTFGSAA